MKVLVTAGSRHGATAEIATAIARAIEQAGYEVDQRPPEGVWSIEPYDAVVIGSAVYAGRWLDAPKRLIEREAVALRSKPVWLFSSGPVGDPALPGGDPPDVAKLTELIHPIGHRVFAGRLDRGDLGVIEKAIVRVVKAPDGDFRSFPEIETWCGAIVRTLSSERVAAGR
jgi:menaquinone-dependent protoporphyrinogen oxidase